MADPTFNEQVVECVKHSIDEKFGQGVREVLFWKFEEGTKLLLTDVAVKPELFIQCMKQIFGDGSASIERTITEAVCLHFHLRFTGNDFVKAVREARLKRFREDLTGP
jgi:hypothetical protein